MGLTMLVAGFILMFQADYVEVETDCYDRYGNEIIGQVCIKKVFDDGLWNNIGSPLMVFGFLITWGGLISIIMDAQGSLN